MFMIIVSATFRDESNQAVVSILVKEVHGINPTFQACDIRGMIIFDKAESNILLYSCIL